LSAILFFLYLSFNFSLSFFQNISEVREALIGNASAVAERAAFCRLRRCFQPSKSAQQSFAVLQMELGFDLSQHCSRLVKQNRYGRKDTDDRA